jgi:hypothetical protein
VPRSHLHHSFDGPAMREAIQADEEMRHTFRALVNATLSATDGPWLFHHEVTQANRLPPAFPLALHTCSPAFIHVDSGTDWCTRGGLLSGNLSQEFDRWFPGSKFVLTYRKSSLALVDSELGMSLRSLRESIPSVKGNGVTLEAAIRSYLTITDRRRQAKLKHLLQKVLVWGLLTQRRYDQHNAAVRAHFAGRPEQLLELCVDCDGQKNPDAGTCL